MRVLLRRQLCVAIAMACFVRMAAGAQIECRLSAKHSAAYNRVEIRFPNLFEVDNPDDPRQADVEGVFVSPSGREWRVPGFLYQDFARQDGHIVPRGKPEWCVRFAPIEPGQWNARVRARVAGKTFSAEAGAFEVTPARARGFLRRSKANPRALEFENGEPLVAIGSNLFPTDAEETTLGKPLGSRRAVEVIRYLERTAKAGGTFCRLRMDYNHLPIEMTADEATGYQGPGRYHAQSCWEVDQIVEAAERLGVTLMLCIECANTTVDNYEGKGSFPLRYNYYLSKYGGPLHSSDAREQFWTDPEVKRLFLQKIRYCVARWGASSAVGVWEFFNELCMWPNRVDQIVAWHRDLAARWRSADPYKRPITSSLLQPYSPEAYWWRVFDAPEIDLVQYHTYDFDDLARGIGTWNLEIEDRADKPLFVGEFGSDRHLWKELDADAKAADGEPTVNRHHRLDPTGVHLHNGIWAAGMTGAVGALPWFTCDYVDPCDLYHVYTGFSRFTADWKLNAGAWRPVATRVSANLDGAGHDRWAPFPLPLNERPWARREEVYTIGRDGSIGYQHAGASGSRSTATFVNTFLFASDPSFWPTFEVDYPADGRLIVTVRYVAADPDTETVSLIVQLDDQEVARRSFPVGEGRGKKSAYLQQKNEWISTYDDQIAIAVPAGTRRIRLGSSGKGRMSVDYTLTPYLDRVLSTYRAYAMGLGDEVRLWVHNTQNTHVNHYREKAPTKAPPAVIRVPTNSSGRYEVEWWDTYKGEPTRHDRVEADEGILTLWFPGTTSDEACIIRRVP